jgi:predicted secreted acid phosphatase
LYGSAIFRNDERKKREMINDIEIKLRKTKITDLEYFFIFQVDDEANHLAAFTSKDPKDKKAYLDKYSKFFGRPDEIYANNNCGKQDCRKYLKI